MRHGFTQALTILAADRDGEAADEQMVTVIHSGPVTTTQDMLIRIAEEAEFTAIGALCVEAYSRGGHLDLQDEYAKTLLDAEARAHDAVLLVAIRDGVLVGTVTICPPASPYAEISRGDESEFRFLAVAPAAWRTGVGEALVEECERRACESGASAHVICVIDSNDSAHRLYRRLGFERLPERDWSPRTGILLQAYRRAVGRA